jgi:hypothetical protein
MRENETVTKEEVYDAQISPLMGQIIAICKEHSINAHMTFDIEDPDSTNEAKVTTVTTHLPLCGNPAWLRQMDYLSRSKNNFDIFMMAVIRDARKYGHGSAYLAILENDSK